ncbi:magnesium transporter CorA family protein [Salix suchowensis]|nr:magnesium transporter CorA family protein [Salix suchowensis]
MARDGYVVPVDPQAVTSVKKKTQPARSWILVDATGQGTILDADKHAIMNRVQIHARDLRILDPLLSYPSTILGREGAIVLNLEHIKAIITSEEVLLRDPMDENVIPVVEELQRRLPPANVFRQGHGNGKDYTGGQLDVEAGEEDESPFEFRALEVALEAICSFLAARTTELETSAYPALDELTSKISSRNLDRVRKLKSAMTRLTARVQKVRDELEQLLDDDDDMADLYLSRKLAGVSSPASGSGGANWFLASPTIGSKISRASRVSLATVHGDENDVEELEMLLEAYFMQIDSTLNKLTTLREYIDDTEDYINIQLDNHRNQLIQVLYDFLSMNCVGTNSLTSKRASAHTLFICFDLLFILCLHLLPQLELYLSSGTVCLTIYSLVAGVFGMNIPYTWNDNHGYMFKWVVIVTGAFCASLFVVLMTYARYKGLVGS